MKIPHDDVEYYIPTDVGQQVHINHTNCSAGTDTKGRLYIKRLPDCIVAYCHNCGGYYFKRSKMYPRNYDALQELLAGKEAAEAMQQTVNLPSDVSTNPADWPAAARAWLWKYYVTDDEIAQYGLCYSPSWGRLIIPVFNDVGKCVFWQGRAIESGGPKYISVKGAKKPLFYGGDSHKQKSATCCIIVEDALSAIAMSRQNDIVGIAALGTDFPVGEFDVNRWKNLIVWFDPDLPGRAKQQELVQRLTPLIDKRKTSFYAARNTLKEPKQYSPDNINKVFAHSNFTRI